MESEGYEPVKDGLYGAWLDDYIFPRAVGTSQGTDLNCYYTVDGYVVAANVGANRLCTEIYKTDYDEQNFEQNWQEQPYPAFVSTTIEKLTSIYVGKEMLDY